MIRAMGLSWFMGISDFTGMDCSDVMAVIEFWVDKNLKLLGGNAEFERTLNVTGGPGELPYYEVLPRICAAGRDAVADVLESGEPLELQGYRFCCLNSFVAGNVSIAPFGRPNQPPEGVRVTIEISKGCEIAERLQQSEHLIDLGKTASSLAHGIRNPLNAIKGAVVYLKEKYSHEKTLQDFSGIIEEEISRLDNFITNFLRNSLNDFSPSESNINGLLKKIELVTAMQAEAGRVRMKFQYGEIPAVRVNPYEFEQAILNVLNNALHVLPHGGSITVESSVEVLNDHRYVQVSIADTGPGLREDSVGACSAPLEGTAKSRGKGFGLFLTREVMQHHQGQFEIKTRRGQGTTVILRLPVDPPA
jgi:two-component system nitrogen regulation sensor histidine kinase GlnL